MAPPLTCLRCGADQPARSLDLDGVQAPALPPCAGCGAFTGCVGLRTAPRAFVLVAPFAAQTDFAVWESTAERLFWRALPAAPRALKRDAEGCLRRVVFGAEALTEKITIWNAGLDDALVECLKLDIRLRRPSLRARPEVDLRLVRADADRLGFASVGGGVWVPRARYDALAAERSALAHRWAPLFRGPWVDHLRLRG